MCSAFTFACTHNSSSLFTPLMLLIYPGDTWHLSWRWADLCLRGSRTLPPHPGGRPALLSSTCLPRTAGICNRNTRWCVINSTPVLWTHPVSPSNLPLIQIHIYYSIYVCMQRQRYQLVHKVVQKVFVLGGRRTQQHRSDCNRKATWASVT